MDQTHIRKIRERAPVSVEALQIQSLIRKTADSIRPGADGQIEILKILGQHVHISQFVEQQGVRLQGSDFQTIVSHFFHRRNGRKQGAQL